MSKERQAWPTFDQYSKDIIDLLYDKLTEQGLNTLRSTLRTQYDYLSRFQKPDRYMEGHRAGYESGRKIALAEKPEGPSDERIKEQAKIQYRDTLMSRYKVIGFKDGAAWCRDNFSQKKLSEENKAFLSESDEKLFADIKKQMENFETIILKNQDAERLIELVRGSK